MDELRNADEMLNAICQKADAKTQMLNTVCQKKKHAKKSNAKEM